MFWANDPQIPSKDASDRPFDAWVVFVYLTTKTEEYEVIHGAVVHSFSSLNSQRANYSEIITERGQVSILGRFGCTARRVPLFLVLNKHPQDYEKGDPFLVVEWGRWSSPKTVANDLDQFTTYFADGNFPALLTRARTGSVLRELRSFVASHAFDELTPGVNFSVAKYPRP